MEMKRPLESAAQRKARKSDHGVVNKSERLAHDVYSLRIR